MLKFKFSLAIFLILFLFNAHAANDLKNLIDKKETCDNLMNIADSERNSIKSVSGTNIDNSNIISTLHKECVSCVSKNTTEILYGFGGSESNPKCSCAANAIEKGNECISKKSCDSMKPEEVAGLPKIEGITYKISYSEKKKNCWASFEEANFNKIVADKKLTDAKTYCEQIGNNKFDEKKNTCKAKKEKGGGLFSNLNIDFDDVKDKVVELAQSDEAKSLAIGVAAGAGVGFAQDKFFEEKCDNLTNDKKCLDIAFQKKKMEPLQEYCEGNKTDEKCKTFFFNQNRTAFKTIWCEEGVTDKDLLSKCKSLGKDAFYETNCTEDKMSALMSDECLAMRNDNPKKFFDIYCDPESDSAKSVKAMPEYKEANGDQVCAPLIKQFVEPEEKDEEEAEESEDKDEEEAEEPEEKDEEDEDKSVKNEDDESDEEESDESEDDDSESTSAVNTFTSSSLGASVASVEHSTVVQDLSNESEERISQLANMGHFNSNPTLCENSMYKVDSDCSMRTHSNYQIKTKIGKVKVVGQKTLVCVYENHTSAKYTTILKRDCQL